MALEMLPPVWEPWTYKDLEGLTQGEIVRLSALLRNKMHLVADRYERQLLHEDRDTYRRIKEYVRKYERLDSMSE